MAKLTNLIEFKFFLSNNVGRFVKNKLPSFYLKNPNIYKVMSYFVKPNN